jgi:hypothetical protein
VLSPPDACTIITTTTTMALSVFAVKHVMDFELSLHATRLK